MTSQNNEQLLKEFPQIFDKMKNSISSFYQEDKPKQGQLSFVEKALVAFFADGHVLLEGIPGVGKTEFVKALIKTIGWVKEHTAQYPPDYSGWRRIQFTPDLMPLDIIGGEEFVLDPVSQRPTQKRFKKGPVFTHILLADEINRASPKTQSALLQGMAEREVSYGNETFPLGLIWPDTPESFPASTKTDRLFFVMATQNPIEQQGTYPLPEAQLDRFFFKIITPLPGGEAMQEVLKTRTADETNITPIIENKAPHEIFRKIVDIRKALCSMPVAKEVLADITFLTALTWPKKQSIANSLRQYVDSTMPRYFTSDAKKKRLEIEDIVEKNVEFGIGPRGAQTLLSALKVLAAKRGDTMVDQSFPGNAISQVLSDAWRHRIKFSLQYETEDTDQVLKRLLEALLSIIPVRAR
jgi:MoxR-like ATPase